MTFIKKYLIITITTIISIIVSLLLITLLYHYNLINKTTYHILKLTTLLLSIFINTLFLGTKSKNKGYLEGIKITSILILISLILTIIFQKFKLKLIIYYITLLITGALGSMIGINIKKKN